MLLDERIRGPFNAVSPEPVQQAGFARALGHALRRPALLPAPAFALRIVLGRERATELLLSSQRVRPGILLASGFRFRSPALGPYLDGQYAGAPGPRPGEA